jgi:hypothetical protein
MAETLDLRKDVPHSMRPFFAGAQLRERLLVIFSLRLHKPVEVVWIVVQKMAAKEFYS